MLGIVDVGVGAEWVRCVVVLVVEVGVVVVAAVVMKKKGRMGTGGVKNDE